MRYVGQSIAGKIGHDQPPPVLLEHFFTQRLTQQRQASRHWISSDRDTSRQLLKFTQQRLHKPPSRVCFEGIDAPFIVAFLDDLEARQALSSQSQPGPPRNPLLVSWCQFLPGPTSRRAGMTWFPRVRFTGALAAWSGFTFPSVIALALCTLRLRHRVTLFLSLADTA